MLLTEWKMFSLLLDSLIDNLLSNILVHYKHMQKFKNFCSFFEKINQIILQKNLQEKNINLEDEVQWLKMQEKKLWGKGNQK